MPLRVWRHPHVFHIVQRSGQTKPCPAGASFLYRSKVPKIISGRPFSQIQAEETLRSPSWGKQLLLSFPLCNGHFTGGETEAQQPRESPVGPQIQHGQCCQVHPIPEAPVAGEPGKSWLRKPNLSDTKTRVRVSRTRTVRNKPCSRGTAPPLLHFSTAARHPCRQEKGSALSCFSGMCMGYVFITATCPHIRPCHRY